VRSFYRPLRGEQLHSQKLASRHRLGMRRCHVTQRASLAPADAPLVAEILPRDGVGRLGGREMKRKPNQDKQATINCGNSDNAKLAYMAMFRYAFGRMTYMPSVVIDIIKANAENLTTSTLELLDRDLTDEAKRYERAYNVKSTSNYSNYGMDCDRDLWLGFHRWVKGEIEKRNSM
jgi:hypothetical protein